MEIRQKVDRKWTKKGLLSKSGQNLEKKENRKLTKMDKRGQKMDTKFTKIGQQRTKVHKTENGQKWAENRQVDKKWTKSVKTKSTKCRQKKDKSRTKER